MTAEERMKELEEARRQREQEVRERNRQRRDQANGADWTERERELRSDKFMTW